VLTPPRIVELQARRRKSTLMHDFHVSKATIYRYRAGVTAWPRRRTQPSFHFRVMKEAVSANDTRGRR
jgi:hypothetical protein